MGLADPDADQGGPKHTDPTDPDPQHCYEVIIHMDFFKSSFTMLIWCSCFRSFSEFVPPSVTTLTLSDNQLLELGRNSSRLKHFPLHIQCCGSGSGIRDPGWVKNQDPGSGINISESLETIFGVKILKFFDADADPDSGSGSLFDSGSDPGSGIHIPDPQHCPQILFWRKSRN